MQSFDLLIVIKKLQIKQPEVDGFFFEVAPKLLERIGREFLSALEN